MKILESASVKDRKHLLELFPIASLREAWPSIKGPKEDLCYTIAEKQPVDEIVKFIDAYFSCCKQHVYIYSNDGTKIEFPASIEGGEKVFEVPGDRAIYVYRTVYDVILKNPPEDASLEFLWSVLIESTATSVIVRFIIFEKSLTSYFDRPFYVSDRSVEEKSVLKALTANFPIQPTDLHKGVKKLWSEDFMDSTRAEYKKPISTARESMDEERGIKEHYPELYEVLQEAPLFNTVFALKNNEKNSVSVFLVDPSRGYIAFLRYSGKSGDTDFVIREILKNN